MTLHYYIVEATLLNGPKKHFVVAPGLDITEQERTTDESASAKGHDVRYCTNFHGIAFSHYEKIERAILFRLGLTPDRYQKGVEINVVAMVTKYVA